MKQHFLLWALKFIYPSLPWVTLDPLINKQKEKKKGRKLLLSIFSHLTTPLFMAPSHSGTTWSCNSHLSLYLAPEWGDLALGGASWAKLIPGLFYDRVKQQSAFMVF